MSEKFTALEHVLDIGSTEQTIIVVNIATNSVITKTTRTTSLQKKFVPYSYNWWIMPLEHSWNSDEAASQHPVTYRNERITEIQEFYLRYDRESEKEDAHQQRWTQSYSSMELARITGGILLMSINTKTYPALIDPGKPLKFVGMILKNFRMYCSQFKIR